MKCKKGVSVAGLHVMIEKALAVADIVYYERGQEVIVTAGTEDPGEHMQDSSHSYGRAVDLRVKFWLLDVQKQVFAELQRLLPVVSKHYRVIFHPGHHIHIQWNPEL